MASSSDVMPLAKANGCVELENSLKRVGNRWKPMEIDRFRAPKRRFEALTARLKALEQGQVLLETVLRGDRAQKRHRVCKLVQAIALLDLSFLSHFKAIFKPL